MKTLTTISMVVLCAGLCLAPFLAHKALADDALQTHTVSFVTAIDSDGDGLTNQEELDLAPPYGPTNPNNPDTDGDGFNDGIESVNPGADGEHLMEQNI